MKKTAIWSIVLALGQISSTRAQSQEDIAKQLAGMWRLVSNAQRSRQSDQRWYAFQGPGRMSLRVDASDAVVEGTFVWERLMK